MRSRSHAWAKDGDTDRDRDGRVYLSHRDKVDFYLTETETASSSASIAEDDRGNEGAGTETGHPQQKLKQQR